MWCLYEAFQEHEEKPEGRLLMLGVCTGNFNYLDRLFFWRPEYYLYIVMLLIHANKFKLKSKNVLLL